jgi:hypothetical protein
MNELLEKAKRDYPVGTKFRSVFTDDQHTSTGNYVMDDDDVFIKNKEGWWCIYYSKRNKWAEIIREETMTQQEYENLKVGDALNDYTIIHKYKQLLIVESKNGHDLLDLDKINKLGFKVHPKTFLGLEIKKYDNVPCEFNGNFLTYLIEIKENSILVAHKKNGEYSFAHTPTSIRIL